MYTNSDSRTASQRDSLSTTRSSAATTTGSSPSFASTDMKSGSKASAANLPEVIVPPRTSVSVAVSLLNQKVEFSMAQERLNRMHWSNIRRARRTSESSTLTSASSLSSRSESGVRFDAASCSTKEQNGEAAVHAPVIDTGVSVTAGSSKVPALPEPPQDSGQVHDYPNPQTPADNNKEATERDSKVGGAKPRCSLMPEKKSTAANNDHEQYYFSDGSTASKAAIWAHMVRRSPPEVSTLPSIIQGSNETNSNTNSVATARIPRQSGKRRRVKILSAGPTTSVSLPDAESSAGVNRREAQSVRKVLQLADVDAVGAPHPTLPPFTAAAPHLHALVRPRATAPQKNVEAEEAQPKVTEAVPSVRCDASRTNDEPSSYVPQQRSEEECEERLQGKSNDLAEMYTTKKEESEASSIAVAQSHPQPPSIGSKRPVQTVLASTYAQKAHIPFSSSLRQPPPLSPTALPPITYSGGISGSTTDYYMGVKYYAPDGAVEEGAVKGAEEHNTSAQPAQVTADLVRPTQHQPPNPSSPVKAESAEDGDEEGGQEFARSTLSYFAALSGGLRSKKLERVQSATTVRAAARWGMAAIVTARPGTAAIGATGVDAAATTSTPLSVSLPRGGNDDSTAVDASGQCGTSRAADISFSFFVAHHMVARDAPAHAPTAAPKPSSSAEFTHSIQQRRATLNASGDGRAVSMNGYDLMLPPELRSGQSMIIEQSPQHAGAAAVRQSESSAAQPVVCKSGEKLTQVFPPLKGSTMDAYTKLHYFDWTGILIEGVAGVAASKTAAALAEGQRTCQRSIEDYGSLLVEAPTDSDAAVSSDYGKSDYGGALTTDVATAASVIGGNPFRDSRTNRGTIDLASVVASSLSSLHRCSRRSSSSGRSSGSDDDEKSVQDKQNTTARNHWSATTTTNISSARVLDKHVSCCLENVVDSLASDAGITQETCRETGGEGEREEEATGTVACVYRKDELMGNISNMTTTSTTRTPPSTATTKSLAQALPSPQPPQRQTREVCFSSPDGEKPMLMLPHPSPHFGRKVADNSFGSMNYHSCCSSTKNGKSTSVNTSFTAHYAAAMSSPNAAVEPSFLSSPVAASALLQHDYHTRSISSSLSSTRDSDNFALWFLEGSVSLKTSDSDVNDDNKEEELGGEGRVESESTGEKEGDDGKDEDDELKDNGFSIDSDFDDHGLAAVYSYNCQSLWRSSEFESDENDSSDGSYLGELLRTDQGESNGSSGSGAAGDTNSCCSDCRWAGRDAESVAGDDANRPRRLLPLSAFRNYYIPEDFIAENHTSAIYKVRERRTHRHYAATFVLHDPGYCNNAQNLFTAELNTGTSTDHSTQQSNTSGQQQPQPMSNVLKLFCAMSLIIQHPNLVQTFDVFYRAKQDATQLQSLVRACTGASNDAASTWAPEIVQAEAYTRSRPRVSLWLPIVAMDTDVLAATEVPVSVVGCSSSLHSTESHPDGEHNFDGNTKAKKTPSTHSPTPPREAAQYSITNTLLRRLFSNLRRGSNSSGASRSSGGNTNSGSNGSTPASSCASLRRGSNVTPAAATAAATSAADDAERKSSAQGRSHLAAGPAAVSTTAAAATVRNCGTVPTFQWPAEAAAQIASRERRVAEMRASRTNESRFKIAERRARIEHLTTLLRNDRVVTVLISELVGDDNCSSHGLTTAHEPNSLYAKARRSGGLPESQLVAVTRGVAAALHYLHTFRSPCLALVHGAVEPPNVMLGANGVVKLVNYANMDWRLSDEEATRKKSVKGHDTTSSERHSSHNQQQQLPLLLQGVSHASHAREPAADLYGLGCTLLTLSSGMPLAYARRLYYSGAFNMLSSSMQSLLKGLLEEKPASRMTAEEVLRHPFSAT